MSTFEIRTDNALTVIVEAGDELDALEQALDADDLADGDGGSVTAYDGRPVGADGDDAP